MVFLSTNESVTLKDVLYVPSLATNLLSIPSAVMKGIATTFTTKDGQPVAEMQDEYGLIIPENLTRKQNCSKWNFPSNVLGMKMIPK